LLKSGLRLLVHSVLVAPILLVHRFRRPLALLAVTFVVAAVFVALLPQLQPNPAPTSWTTSIGSGPTSVAGLGEAASAAAAASAGGAGAGSASSASQPPGPSRTLAAGSSVVPDVIVADFSVSDDLSTALIGLANAAGVTFLGPEGSLQADGSGTLRIPLDFASDTDPDSVTVTVSGVPFDVLQVNYYPAAYYESIGIDSAGVVDLFTTLPRSDNAARVEPTASPTDASLAVDEAAWDQVRVRDGFPAAGASLDDQIRQLYMDFDKLNDPSVGTVCASTLTGISQFGGISSQSCYVTCTGYTRITRDFLRSLATPARYISLGGRYSYLPNGVLVESSDGHDTTDMWVDGEWQWLDPTLRVLQATGPDGKILTLDEVMQALSDASTRSGVSFTRLNPATDEWQTLSYGDEDAAFKHDLSDYLSADKIMVIGNGGAG
jgi:hypothetical protein